MVARKEFRIQQGERPGADRNRLAHADDLAVDIGGVDLIADHAGIGLIDRGRDFRQGTGQGGGAHLGHGRGGDTEAERKGQGGNGQTKAHGTLAERGRGRRQFGPVRCPGQP